MTAMALKLLLLLLWVGFAVSTVVDLHKRIFHGHSCEKNERLHHVKVISSNKTHGTFCGGSLIHEQWVLTAAHCLKDGWDISAVLGVHPGPGQTVAVTAGSIFEEKNVRHDIMLLKLATPSKIKPIALPDCKNPPQKGAVIQVAGFGRYRVDETYYKLPGQPPHLQCGNMYVVDCEPTRNNHCYSQELNVPYNNRLCVQDPRVDVCQGDSGGGVIYNSMIYGVISSGCVYACTEPAVTANVCSYMTWINQKIYTKSNGK